VSEFLVRIIRHELEPAKEKTDTPKPTRTATRKGSTYTIDTSRIDAIEDSLRPDRAHPG
jgi:hypothetical protein